MSFSFVVYGKKHYLALEDSHRQHKHITESAREEEKVAVAALSEEDIISVLFCIILEKQTHYLTSLFVLK